MAGHMGAVQRTAQNLEVVRVDAERNLLLVKGAVPGATNGDVVVKLSVKAVKGGSNGITDCKWWFSREVSERPLAANSTKVWFTRQLLLIWLAVVRVLKHKRPVLKCPVVAKALASKRYWSCPCGYYP